MPKMKIIQADGSCKIVEDETFKNTRWVPRIAQHQQRSKVIETILESLKITDGQTTEQLAESTNIPAYYLNTYLLELEKAKRIARGGQRHYLVAALPLPESAI